jgi:hypothetical protein
MENKNLKKSFALLSTLLLVIVFSLVSIRLVETNLLSSNLNSLKYLHLQATIYMDTISKYIETHSTIEIQQYQDSWNDDRFSIQIIQDDNNSSIYYSSIQTIDKNSHVRLSQKIIK